MSELLQRAGIAEAEVLESGELVVRPTSEELRAELADFVRRVGRGATFGAWTEAPGPPRRPVLALELRSASGTEAFRLGLALPAELWMTAPRGPLTVAIMLSESIVDPAEPEAELADGLIIATPELVR